jgi:CDP-diacylglycerol--serine O-phosphatidyltransferase
MENNNIENNEINTNSESQEIVEKKAINLPNSHETSDKLKDRKKNLRKHLAIIPNTCTSMNLVCGFLSILMASQGEFIIASWLIMGANIFDILDGRLARLTSVESMFGAELDSLCDLVSFGVAPAFLVYSRFFKDGSLLEIIIGITAVTIFVLCGALRLARFNVTPHSKKDVFEGMPIPGGAGILATMIIFEFYGFVQIPRNITPFVVLITAFLMVSSIEYPAMKKTPKTSYNRIIAVMLIVSAFCINPPITLFFATWGYAVYGLFMATLRSSLRIVRKIKNKKNAEDY